MNPVIFDFDGTLANSGPIIIECFDLTLKEEQGKEYPPEFYKPFIGPPLEETFGFLGAEDPARYITTYRRHYFQRMYDTPLFDGVRAMLEHLDDMGVPMAIATSKRRDAVLLLMQHLGIEERFKVVCGSGDDPSRGKKQHRVEDALTGLQELGIDTSGAIMVGDRIHDIEGAAANGLDTILVEWGEAPPEERDEAWRIVETPEELEKLLLSR
ncbi:MAG: HAD hydrolase-like protein [Ancrocorticia sp.]